MFIDKIEDELIKNPENFILERNFDAGKVRSRFFTELRDNKRIIGTRCPQCGRIGVPAKHYCGQCNVEMSEWVDCGTEGVLKYFDVQYKEAISPRTGKLRAVPWARCVIGLDGGGNILHFVYPPDPAALKIGDRYRAVFNETRTGAVTDILYFERCEDQTPKEVEVKVIDEPPFKGNITNPGVLNGATSKTYGTLGSKFFVQLKANHKIMASRCHKCGITFAPPESICPECFEKIDELVELSGKGTVKSYTVVEYPEKAHTYPAPFAYAIIQMDGADTAMTHILGEIDLDTIETGMRVEPVFRKLTQGNIMDIKYFRPAK